MKGQQVEPISLSWIQILQVNTLLKISKQCLCLVCLNVVEMDTRRLLHDKTYHFGLCNDCVQTIDCQQLGINFGTIINHVAYIRIKPPDNWGEYNGPNYELKRKLAEW